LGKKLKGNTYIPLFSAIKLGRGAYQISQKILTNPSRRILALQTKDFSLAIPQTKNASFVKLSR
jgi:hypothetical protein